MSYRTEWRISIRPWGAGALKGETAQKGGEGEEQRGEERKGEELRFWHILKKKKTRHRSTEGRTDIWTDGRTDTTSYCEDASKKNITAAIGRATENQYGLSANGNSLVRIKVREKSSKF